MSEEKKIITNYDIAKRRKRVNRLKTIIVLVIVVLLLLPTLLCIMLFFKLSYLEREIKTLKTFHQEEYEAMIDTKDNEKTNIVYAADGENAYNSSMDVEIENTEKKDDSEKKDDTLINSEQDKEIKEKKVYLTFDDGPSKNTDLILDILKEYDVKATFFVTGKTDQHSLAMYKRIVEEGHTLGMHSYSHQYSSIYKSLESFKKDFTKLSDLLYDTTGVRPTIYRFPGGSSNLVSGEDMGIFIDFLVEQGITYYDWNVMNGDATSKELTVDTLYNNVISGVKGLKSSVVLMHDLANKDNTVSALPRIIKKLKKDNYDILPINSEAEVVQHKRKS